MMKNDRTKKEDEGNREKWDAKSAALILEVDKLSYSSTLTIHDVTRSILTRTFNLWNHLSSGIFINPQLSPSLHYLFTLLSPKKETFNYTANFFTTTHKFFKRKFSLSALIHAACNLFN